MRWTNEEIIKLRKSIEEGKSYEDLILLFKRSRASLVGKLNELGLKTIVNFKEICVCKECLIKFEANKKEKRKFCTSNCAAKFNNKNREPYSEEKRKEISNKVREKLLGRKVSSEIKEKISGDKNGRYKGLNRESKNIVTKIVKGETIKVRVCRNCKINEVVNKKIICEHCRINYYQYYRPSCEFRFKEQDYPDKFDLKLIKKLGRYSPSNKGDNLNGVSRDHMYSVKEGFVNNIDPSIISHPANCQLLVHTDNNKKKTTSSITLEELKSRIENW